MDLTLSPKYRDLQAEVQAFVKTHGQKSPKSGGGRQKPSARALDWQKLLLEHGYVARNIPREYGGSGLPFDVLEHAVIADELAKGGVSPGIMNQGISMFVPTLLEVGTPEQCRQWINTTIRGDTIWCQGYSEPGSGSDLAAAKTHARIEDGAKVGLNATVLPFRTVGHGAEIGAHAVVTRDVPPGEVWSGVPARPMPAGKNPTPYSMRAV